jgi:hypothetical protein
MPILTRVVWAMLIAFTAATASTAVETSAGGPMTVFDFTCPGDRGRSAHQDPRLREPRPGNGL